MEWTVYNKGHDNHTHTHAHAHAHTHTNTHAHTHSHAHKHPRTHTHTNTHTHTHLRNVLDERDGDLQVGEIVQVGKPSGGLGYGHKHVHQARGQHQGQHRCGHLGHPLTTRLRRGQVGIGQDRRGVVNREWSVG